jgi:hypothetical protein
MRHEEYGHTHWKAEDMAAYLRDKTGVHVDKVERPSFSRSGWFPLLVLAILLTGARPWALPHFPYAVPQLVPAAGAGQPAHRRAAPFPCSTPCPAHALRCLVLAILLTGARPRPAPSHHVCAACSVLPIQVRAVAA